MVEALLEAGAGPFAESAKVSCEIKVSCENTIWQCNQDCKSTAHRHGPSHELQSVEP